jgi:hypothetical protein
MRSAEMPPSRAMPMLYAGAQGSQRRTGTQKCSAAVERLHLHRY